MENLQPGQELGPYRIINQVGQGGMATVYKAYHAAMDRYVALKVLPRQLAENPEFTGRFRQEAHTLAHLEHPRILPVYDSGESEGVTYLVMRYLEAGTLKDRLRAGPLSLKDIDRYFTQLADALEYAHERNVVHRDLKPSNVMVDTRGNVFLTDFGIAKLLESTAHFTSTGGLIGTPAYMSPEQAQGIPVDPRSDIYSLGIILYEMVTGRVPFEAETPLAVVLKHLNEPLPPPSSIKPGISSSIERLLLKALAKNPADRFATVADFVTAWQRALAESETERMAVPPALPVAALPEKVPPPAEPELPASPVKAPPPPTARKKRWVWAVGCAAALMVCTCLSCWLLGSARTAADATQTAMWAGKAAATAPPGSETPLPATKPATAAATSVPAPTPAAQWTSWTPANAVYAAAVWKDMVYASGPGGLTVWDRKNGSIIRRNTVADGLPGVWANVLLLDNQDGTLWVGGDEGVAEYNGQRWITYGVEQGLDSTNVGALTWTKAGLLVGTHYSGVDGGGLNLLTTTGFKPVSGFPSAHPDENPNKLANSVNAIAEDNDGNLWVGTWNGLGRFDGKAWTRFTTDDGLPNNFIITLYVSNTGEVWAGAQGGAVKFNGKRFEPVQGLGLDEVHGILQDRAGDYWFVGAGGARHLTAGTNTIHAYDSSTGDIAAYNLFGIAQDADGRLYFASDPGGVIRYDGQQFSAWLAPNVPTYTTFDKIVPAAKGRLWFVKPYDAGVNQFDPQDGQWSSPANLPAEGSPWGVDTQGNVWGLEWNSVWRLDANGQLARLTTEQGLPAGQVTTVAFAPKDTVWIGTESGLAFWDGQQIVRTYNTKNAPLTQNTISALLVTSDGALWAGTGDGVSRLQPNGDWDTAAGTKFAEANAVTDIAETADGAVWVTTHGGGAYRFGGGEWKQFNPDDDPQVKLPAADVNCVTVAPDGRVWFGTEAGAAYYDSKAWSRVGSADGLISAFVNDIYVEPAGVVWFATSGGVSRYRP